MDYMNKIVVNFENNLYIVSRIIKEETINEDEIQEYKKYIGCDTVLKKNKKYFFCNKIEDAQLIEDELLIENKPN